MISMGIYAYVFNNEVTGLTHNPDNLPQDWLCLICPQVDINGDLYDVTSVSQVYYRETDGTIQIKPPMPRDGKEYYWNGTEWKLVTPRRPWYLPPEE